MTGTWEQRMNKTDYLNWLKLGLCLLYMCVGIGDFAKDIINNFHERLQTQLGTVLCPTRRPCQTRRPQTPPDDQCPTCGPWKTAILKEHAKAHQSNWRYSWGNCDPLKWPTHSWEVAKVYMPVIGNHANKCVDPATTDSSGLLNLIINCKVFHSHFSNVQTAENVKGVRNKVMHSSKMSFTDQELKDGVETILQFLQDGKELIHNQEAQGAVKSIKEIEDIDLAIIKKNEVKLIQEVLIYLTRLEQRIDQMEESFPNDEIIAQIQELFNENADLKEKCDKEWSFLQSVIQQHGERLSSVEGRVTTLEGQYSNLQIDVNSPNETSSAREEPPGECTLNVTQMLEEQELMDELTYVLDVRNPPGTAPIEYIANEIGELDYNKRQFHNQYSSAEDPMTKKIFKIIKTQKPNIKCVDIVKCLNKHNLNQAILIVEEYHRECRACRFYYDKVPK